MRKVILATAFNAAVYAQQFSPCSPTPQVPIISVYADLEQRARQVSCVSYDERGPYRVSYNQNVPGRLPVFSVQVEFNLGFAGRFLRNVYFGSASRTTPVGKSLSFSLEYRRRRSN